MGDVPAALLRPFDLTNLPYTCTGSRCGEHEIRDRRKALGGQLFIDRLLSFAGIDGPAQYPPTTPSGLRRLLAAIHESDVDRLKRDCFVYYLARDVDAAASGGAKDNNNNNGMEVDSAGSANSTSSTPEPDAPARAAAFARTRCLPRTWRTYMDGYWFLDHAQWDRAVDCLRDPCLADVDFAREIVAALTTQVSPPAHALALVNAFLSPRASAGNLASEEESEAALLATASVAGMAAAFDTIRALPEESERSDAREAVWCWSLGGPRSPAGKGAHTAQPAALKQLLHLALSDDEHAHLVAFLAHPPRDIPPAARSLLHDLVTLRLVHAGKYEETLALDKELAGTDAASAADRQRRREMVREFIDILPAAQRRILLGDRVANGNGAMDAEDVDMAASWVDVQREADKDKENEQQKEQERQKADKEEKDRLANAKQQAAPAPAPAPPQPIAPSTPVRPIAAPTPIRTAVAFRNLQTATPARSGAASPFGGPPRFPASPAVASPHPSGSRSTSPSRMVPSIGTPARSAASSPEPLVPATPSVASTSTPVPASAVPAALRPSPPRAHASPFQAPASTSKPAARKPKKVIDDTPRRSARARRIIDDEDEDADAVLRAPSEPPIPEDEPAPTPARRSRRTIAPPPPHETTPKRAPRARASRASTIEPDHDDPVLPGAFETRGTRSAATAALDEPEPAPETKRAKGKVPASRRTTRATSEMTDDGAGAGAGAGAAVPDPMPEPPARRTRRVAAAASERGSPTPSVASSAASPSRRRRTVRETSATPRATRSRKAKE